MSVENDVKIAKEAMTHFHNEALSFPENYSMTYQQLIDYYQAKTKGYFLEGLGFAINAIELPSSRVKSGMEKLAREGEGKLPKWNDFYQRMGNEGSNPTFLEAASATLSGTVSDVASGFKDVGGAVISTAKNTLGILPMLPYLAVLAGGFYVYMSVKRRA